MRGPTVWRSTGQDYHHPGAGRAASGNMNNRVTKQGESSAELSSARVLLRWHGAPSQKRLVGHHARLVRRRCLQAAREAGLEQRLGGRVAVELEAAGAQRVSRAVALRERPQVLTHLLRGGGGGAGWREQACGGKKTSGPVVAMMGLWPSMLYARRVCGTRRCTRSTWACTRGEAGPSCWCRGPSGTCEVHTHTHSLPGVRSPIVPLSSPGAPRASCASLHRPTAPSQRRIARATRTCR